MIISVLQRLLGKVINTNYIVQKHDGQTDTQAKRFGYPGGAQSLSLTKFSMVIADLEHILAPQKHFWIRYLVLLLRGTENLG